MFAAAYTLESARLSADTLAAAFSFSLLAYTPTPITSPTIQIDRTRNGRPSRTDQDTDLVLAGAAAVGTSFRRKDCTVCTAFWSKRSSTLKN